MGETDGQTRELMYVGISLLAYISFLSLFFLLLSLHPLLVEWIGHLLILGRLKHTHTHTHTNKLERAILDAGIMFTFPPSAMICSSSLRLLLLPLRLDTAVEHTRT